MRILRNITGFAATSAFLFVSLLNQQLTYNADMFREDPVAFDLRLVEMHTNSETGEFYSFAKEANYLNLARFFALVRD